MVAALVLVATRWMTDDLNREAEQRAARTESERAASATVAANLDFVRERSGSANVAKPFSRMNLAGTSMAGLDLACEDEVQLGACADFIGADLTGADMSRAMLQGAQFSDILSLETSSSFSLRWPQTSMMHRCGNAATAVGVDFTNANLSRATLCGADLNGANFGSAVLTEADLIGTHLTDADLVADLRAANLTDARLNSVTISAFAPPPWTVALQEEPGFRLALVRARLENVRATHARLPQANLASATLNNVDLASSLLVDANMRGATLTQVDLRSANLSGADLTDAIMGDGICTNESTVWPSGFARPPVDCSARGALSGSEATPSPGPLDEVAALPAPSRGIKDGTIVTVDINLSSHPAAGPGKRGAAARAGGT